MNFCAAVLILKMEEDMNTLGILCFLISRKVKMQLKHTHIEKICAVYGEGAVSDRTCQKWFVKFLGAIDILAK